MRIAEEPLRLHGEPLAARPGRGEGIRRPARGPKQPGVEAAQHTPSNGRRHYSGAASVLIVGRNEVRGGLQANGWAPGEWIVSIFLARMHSYNNSILYY